MPQRREGGRCTRARHEDRNRCREKGLCSLGVPLEVWIRNDTLTFNTAYHAGLAFLFRGTTGNHATVHTGERRFRWEGL